MRKCAGALNIRFSFFFIEVSVTGTRRANAIKPFRDENVNPDLTQNINNISFIPLSKSKYAFIELREWKSYQSFSVYLQAIEWDAAASLKCVRVDLG